MVSAARPKYGSMGYVHYCVFCGTHDEAATATMLKPECTGCGCPLRACQKDEWPQIAASLADRREAHKPRLDGAGPLALMIVGPWMLALLGVEIRDVLYAVPLVFSIFAGALCLSAAKRPDQPRLAWLTYAASAFVAAGASAIAMALEIADRSLLPAFEIGSASSVLLLIALVLHVGPRLTWLRPEKVLDAAQALILVIAAAVYFVVRPGFAAGVDLLTAVVVVDLVAFVVAGVLASVGRRREDVVLGRRIWTMAGLVLAANALVAADAGGAISAGPELSAVLLAGAGWFLAGAAIAERTAPTPKALQGDEETSTEWRWFTRRVLTPTLIVLAFPAVLTAAILADGATAWPLAWFGGAFVLVLLLAFARQAYLLVDHRRASVLEARQRRSLLRRNEELEALTGLATTMTQTLEEAPIVEQALTVLHAAARATSSALHVHADGKLKLRAAAGRWSSEHPWADRVPRVDEPSFVRGGRQVTRLPLAARGHAMGWVTFIRPGENPLAERDLDLLRLLVDQMAVAVANARDYREKLEQAVRDPLTGIYNRRYFFEVAEKEVQRSVRYGSSAALVIIDVDKFKAINDSRGHAVGDAVLRGIAATAEGLLRPVDTFARVGGEEFALLLPETDQLDALLIAERIRAAISRTEMAEGVQVTISAGVGSCPADAQTREDLMRRVDGALYWAKRNGRDMCAVVNEATDGTVEHADDEESVVANFAAIVTAIDAQQLDTRDHSDNVAMYAVSVGQALELDRDRLVRLRRAALLHDIGKVAVRQEVLEKPAGLTDHEFDEIKLHPTVGATMLHHAGLAQESAWVRHHHERLDGRGYPDGLAGEAIPLESRIIFVADSFEAMTSDRPYRAGMTVAAALTELRACAGSQFDPRVVELFCELVEGRQIEVMALRTGV